LVVVEQRGWLTDFANSGRILQYLTGGQEFGLGMGESQKLYEKKQKKTNKQNKNKKKNKKKTNKTNKTNPPTKKKKKKKKKKKTKKPTTKKRSRPLRLRAKKHGVFCRFPRWEF